MLNYTTNQPKISGKTPPPILVMLHGYGADEFDLISIASQLDPAFLTISLQAPTKLSWGGYSWYELTQTQEGLKGDDESRIASENFILESLPQIIAKEGGDPTNIFLLGFSQGTAMCYSLIGRHDLSEIGISLRGVIALSGYIPNDVKELLRKKHLASVPFFLSHGTFDELIPAFAMHEAQKILEEAGAKTLAKEYEIGHGLNEETVSDIRNWIKSVKD